MRHRPALILLALLMPLSAAHAQQSLEGRVIVRWKAEAETLRAHPLAARASEREVGDVMQRRARVLAERSGTALETGRAIDARTQVMVAQGIDSASLAHRLSMDPRVELVAVDRKRYVSRVPNDPQYANASAAGGPVVGQWYLKPPGNGVVSSINAETAWNRTTGSASVAVAVIDTGVRLDHPDLAGNLLPGYDMIGAGGGGAVRLRVANDGDLADADPSDPGDWVDSSDQPVLGSSCDVEDSSWHGTRVAGLVAAVGDNGVGIAGTAYGAKVVPIRALGKCGGYDSDIIAGMNWAVGVTPPGIPVTNANPVKVINMSLGSSGACTGSTGQLYRDAIATANARGAVVVVAAGNSAGEPVDSPANCTGAIAVLGLRHVGTKVGFSSMGAEVTIAAPGGNCVNLSGACLYPMLSTTNTGTRSPLLNSYTGSSASVGTSFATPLVAGVAALMFSVDPSLTPTRVRSLLQQTARAFPSSGGGTAGDPPPGQCPAPVTGTSVLECYCNTSTCGAGMMDAAAAVDAVAAGAAPVVSASATPSSPTAGGSVALSSSASSPGGRSISSYAWAITAGGNLASFSGATNASTATLLTSGAGTVTVQLTVTDSAGLSSSASTSITVAAAPTPAPAPAPATGGGGGGSSSPLWLALLALAAALCGRAGPRVSRSA